MRPTPYVAPAQSRAGLITSLVISVLLFFTAAFIAMYCHNQWQAEFKKTAEAQTEANANAEKARKALEERDDAIKPIVGVGGGTVDTRTQGAENDIQRAVQAATITLAPLKDIAPILKTDNIPDNLRTLSETIVTLSKQVDAAKAALDAAIADKNSFVSKQPDLLKAKDDDMKKAADAAAAALDAAQKQFDSSKKSIDDITAKANDDVTKASNETKIAQDEVTKLQALLKTAVDKLQKVTDIIARYRANPSRALLQPAGLVTRAPGNNTVFINLGDGQQIPPGLTFEVYDRKKGLPNLAMASPENPDALPSGKGFIEVIRILPNTSECRIIHEEKGMHISEGDLILNLIYNTHTKFAFFMYGDFDLSNSGQTVPGDIDVLRRLAVQWGGRVMDHVGIETDFLVLGREPVIHPLPETPTAVDNERHDREVKAQTDFLAVQTDAFKLHIPVLNQNRFLYFVGYYDQAKR